MRTIQNMIDAEVCYCVSGLVSTLAQGYGLLETPQHRDLADLTEQAFELASPVLDYEEAAREAGAELDSQADNDHGWRSDTGDEDWGFASQEQAAIDFCDVYHIEPHEHEVFEHWAVTEWLADKLEEAGERVDRDFAGMTVWARTTTGQAIYADAVIRRIYADLVSSVEG